MFSKLTATAIALAAVGEAVDLTWESPYYSGRQNAYEPKASSKSSAGSQGGSQQSYRPKRPTFAIPLFDVPTPGYSE